jgi:hypothetical protein
MTDHNARQAGLTSILGPDEDGLPIERYSHRSFGMAPHPNGTYVRYSEVERRLAAHSADARNGEGVANIDGDAIFAAMYKRDPYWDTQERSSAAAVRLALACARALLAAPAAPAPKCTRCEYIGKCDCEPAPAPAAQAEAYYDGTSKEPTLMWVYPGYQPAPSDVVLYTRQQSTAPAPAAQADRFERIKRLALDAGGEGGWA